MVSFSGQVWKIQLFDSLLLTKYQSKCCFVIFDLTANMFNCLLNFSTMALVNLFGFYKGFLKKVTLKQHVLSST